MRYFNLLFFIIFFFIFFLSFSLSEKFSPTDFVGPKRLLMPIFQRTKSNFSTTPKSPPMNFPRGISIISSPPPNDNSDSISFPLLLLIVFVSILSVILYKILCKNSKKSEYEIIKEIK